MLFRSCNVISRGSNWDNWFFRLLFVEIFTGPISKLSGTKPPGLPGNLSGTKMLLDSAGNNGMGSFWGSRNFGFF
ncbi:hypothetical protein SQ11_15470, partial [Nitrosospira sp. NpAV]